MSKANVGFAMCGSFCTFKKVIPQIEELISLGFNVVPIMSGVSYSTDTRFGKAEDFIKQIEDITGKKIIHTISGAEPIGPKKLLDALIIAPCTGNTLGKMANGITDTSVTLAAKAHLRNARPVIIAVSTNDALGAAAKNIGLLMNSKNVYFVPMSQDDPENKPNSIVADFTKIPETLKFVLAEGKQNEPLFI
ncbi:MAG: dipicolinate synthase subunit B [Oscillospiraceae bacterium]|nr:dipicolinate synthase subunit B [Oscillospiraceae bacterium]